MNDGTLVRARVMARLFGRIKLLTLEAQVVVEPAELETPAPALPPRRRPKGEPRPIGPRPGSGHPHDRRGRGHPGRGAQRRHRRLTRTTRASIWRCP